MMSDPGKDNNYGSITDPILSPSPADDMTETELSEMADTAANTDPLKGSNNLPEEMELNKVYETIGVGTSQGIFWTISFLIAYSDYAELTLIALIMPYLRCEWDLTETFEATITITIFFIYAISALIFGKVSDIYGRKRVMSVTIVILVITAVGAALATNKYIFLVWRSIAGACIGANFATVVVYSTEFSPTSHKSVGPLISLMGSYVSMFLVNIVGYFAINALGWRWVIIIITIPIIPGWILLMIMPETPRYLCVSGKNEAALKAVRLMAKLNKASLPENLEVFCHQNKQLGSFKMILGSGSEHRKPAVLLSIMYFCNIFIETAVLVFLPLAFISQFCGGESGAPERDRCQPLSQSDLWKLSGSAFGSLAGCMAAYFVAKCLGRLKPTRGSNILQIITFGLMFKCFNDTYLFGVATVIKIINAFICMMIWFIIPESFPTMIRNTATGMINSSGKLGAVLGTAMVYLLFYASPVAVVICFVVISAITCICSFLLTKETQDVALMDT
ncbi:putative transporter svop-1 isoform X1 [Bolinopsis microptera]|uniref:putative transporter svop-1 isoform X1 n=2 Tax=Bolinopsis microptera TaxID=2820187 RepID=UPI003079EA9B